MNIYKLYEKEEKDKDIIDISNMINAHNYSTFAPRTSVHGIKRYIEEFLSVSRK